MSDEQDWPLSQRVDVARLPGSGLHVVLEPTPAECSAIATRLGILGIQKCSARMVLLPRGKRVAVKGSLKADVTQACVVTLEPVAERIDEEIDLVFATPDEVAAAEAKAFAELEDGSRGLNVDPVTLLDPETLPEPFDNGQIDVWIVALETLSLGLNPYPRKDGVVFEPPATGDDSNSPFAALKGLAKPT